MRAVVLAVLLGLALAAPAGLGGAAPAPGPSGAEICRAHEGEMRKVCKSQFPTCVRRFSDGGKPCTDGSQCKAGRCVHQGEDVAAGTRGGGACDLNNDPCGCRNLVVGGRTKGWLCTD
jgi:hypothetical protein